MKGSGAYIIFLNCKESIAGLAVLKTNPPLTRFKPCMSNSLSLNSFKKALAPFFNWIALAVVLGSCTISKQISIEAKKNLLKDIAISTGHMGISIYEPATSKYWYNFNGEKYFVPASNAKLFTLYAGMRYLGDSLVGLRYEKTSDSNAIIIGAGDPSFLHPDFKTQPVLEFLKKNVDYTYLQDPTLSNFSPLGNGWAWDDYQSDYAAERSEMPIYGNLAKFYLQNDSLAVSPPIFYNHSIQRLSKALKNGAGLQFAIERPLDGNLFHVQYHSPTKFSGQWIPFRTITHSLTTQPTFMGLLEDTLHKKIGQRISIDQMSRPRNVIHSQPTDSLLKPMMHRSDNFFAEQTLLMASNEHLGMMSDEKIIDTILQSDLLATPQRPKWVDGSGLSRYNLFTPQSFVYILNKMKNDFGFERLKNILPTGGEGTLSAYYQQDAGFIFAKTGTLSNHSALSGFLITKKNKLLIFSILANQYATGATPVRRAVEKFLTALREKY